MPRNRCSNSRGRAESYFTDEELSLRRLRSAAEVGAADGWARALPSSFSSFHSLSRALSCLEANRAALAAVSCVCLEVVKHGLGVSQGRVKHWEESGTR